MVLMAGLAVTAGVKVWERVVEQVAMEAGSAAVMGIHRAAGEVAVLVDWMVSEREAERQALEMVEELVRTNLAFEQPSSFNHNVMLVPKPMARGDTKKKWRMVSDLRLLSQRMHGVAPHVRIVRVNVQILAVFL